MMRDNMKRILCVPSFAVFTVLYFVLAVPVVMAADQEPIQMKGTNIRGSTELPKVLYIVPWKKAELGDILMQAGVSMFDDELAPIDRDVFRRQVQYYDMIREQDKKTTAKK